MTASGIPATILRPWYVLGPGHRWPYLLTPFYAALRWIPPTHASAARLGLVTLDAMTATLVRAIEAPQWWTGKLTHPGKPGRGKAAGARSCAPHWP